MALEKQPISISFDNGIDTKRDPKQIALGKLLMLRMDSLRLLIRFKSAMALTGLRSQVS